MSDNTFTCYKCGGAFPFEDDNPRLAYNMGFGLVRYCRGCCPPATEQEIIESFERFMNPPKERDVSQGNE